jgi:hypothetical protein
MVSRGMDRMMAWVCLASRWTSSRLSELLVSRLGLVPNPLPWPFLVCDPSSRMFCTPYTGRLVSPVTLTTLMLPYRCR